MNHGKLGKHPVDYSRPRLWLGKYTNRSTIPPQPPINYKDFLGQQPWEMLGNGPDPTAPPQIAATGVGDCFFAAATHAIMARSASTGRLVVPGTAACLGAYAACTGWNVNDPNTDQGTAALSGMDFLKTVGIQLPDGSFNKLAGYVAVNPKDPEEVQLAHAIFGGVLIGVVFHEDWMDAPVWDVTNGRVVGGHMIYGFSNIQPDGLSICTWGEDRLITYRALASECDEMFVVIDDDFLNPDGITISGLDKEQLNADLSQIAA